MESKVINELNGVDYYLIKEITYEAKHKVILMLLTNSICK